MFYITDTAGMRRPIMEFIDALLPLLPGRPQDYVTPAGRLDMEMVSKGTTPHSHTTGAAADLIQELWTGRSSLSLLFGHADSFHNKGLADALREFADAIDEET